MATHFFSVDVFSHHPVIVDNRRHDNRTPKKTIAMTIMMFHITKEQRLAENMVGY